MKPLDLYYITMTRYDETYKEVKVVFDKDHLENTLGETVSNVGKPNSGSLKRKNILT